GNVSVVAPEVGQGVDELSTNGRIHLTRREFRASDLDGVRLVIAATADLALNHSIVEQAGQRGLLANAVTDADAGEFIMPAIVDRSPVLISVSTGGASPALSRLIRAKLETVLPKTYGRLASLAGEYRERVKRSIHRPSARRAFWDRVLEGPIAEMVHSGRIDAAHEAIDAELRQTQRLVEDVDPGGVGEVYLVGAGPGDPDLLSLRAMRLIQQADVVVYDRLVSDAILDLVRRDADRIYAGKRRSQHTLQQESINELLVRLAREGKRVLRLKGGDPFMFGRGGEEIETLSQEQIPFQVVPGITAASGCAAYAGIPLTHRDHAHACIFVTGHLQNGTVDLDWPTLAKTKQTVVFYMGLVALPIIAEKLVAHGLTEGTPCALIQQGTTPSQQVIVGALSTISALSEGVKAPALLIVGEVVSLRERLQWFVPKVLGDAAEDEAFSERAHRERATLDASKSL
ncbi:MAG: siroheme synthase CysG, partial [Gammaproteobacteria bacterium]|nr:siroheme synthase CysG [Gammaproteobacteria bacterium]